MTPAADNNSMTPLDQAYVNAVQSRDESIFYNSFLNSTLFIPTVDVPETEQHGRAGDDDTISPVIIESEGQRYLMLFDTEERLASWAQREIGFAAIPGYAVVEMMSLEFHWALNVGTEHTKIFVPDEIEWLKSGLKQVQEEAIPPGTEVLIGTPAKIPAGLIESLKKNLSSRNGEVQAAYLGQVYYAKKGERPHLALVVDLSAKERAVAAAICQDLAASTRGLLGEGEYIDIMVNDGTGTAAEIANTVQPFYKNVPAK